MVFVSTEDAVETMQRDQSALSAAGGGGGGGGGAAQLRPLLPALLVLQILMNR